MNEALADPNVVQDQLGGAQRMAEWVGDYMYGLRTDMGEINPLAEIRCEALVRKELTKQSFDHIMEMLMLEMGDAQSDVAYYLCGYPPEALALFVTPEAPQHIDAFKQLFAVPKPEPELKAPEVVKKPREPRASTPKAVATVAVAQEAAVIPITRPPRRLVLLPTVAVIEEDYAPGVPLGNKGLYLSESQAPEGMFTPTKELDWEEQALCAQTDPEAFYPEKGGSTREAKKICAGCEVRLQCLEYALGNDERFGIWGGLSERERRRVKRGKPAEPAVRPELAVLPEIRFVPLVEALSIDSVLDPETIKNVLQDDETQRRRFIQATLGWYSSTTKDVSKKELGKLYSYFTGEAIDAFCTRQGNEGRLVSSIRDLYTFIGSDDQHNIADPLKYCWDQAAPPDNRFQVLNYIPPKPTWQHSLRPEERNVAQA